MTTTPTFQAASSATASGSGSNLSVSLARWGSLADGDIVVLQAIGLVEDSNSIQSYDLEVDLSSLSDSDPFGVTRRDSTNTGIAIPHFSWHRLHSVQVAIVTVADTPATYTLTMDDQYPPTSPTNNWVGMLAYAVYRGAGDYQLAAIHASTNTSPAMTGLSGDLFVRGYGGKNITSAIGTPSGYTSRQTAAVSNSRMALMDRATSPGAVTWSPTASAFGTAWSVRIFEDTTPSVANTHKPTSFPYGYAPSTRIEI